MMKKFIALSFLTCSFLLNSGLFAAERYTNNASYESIPVLYYSDSCGHCHKVKEFLQKNHITVNMKNIAKANYRKELLDLGKKGVPVLVDNGKVYVGSTNIISHFSN